MRILILVATFAACACACEVNLGEYGSTNCGKDTLFCTWDSLATRSCRACIVDPHGPLTALGVYDSLNMCNCLPGEYCRQTGERELGVCTPSQLVGRNCSTDDDCQGALEPAVNGTAPSERGFCVAGVCKQCDPDAFAFDWGGDPYMCPGYKLGGGGDRIYTNVRPGTTVSCLPDGSLSAAGTINWDISAYGVQPISTDDSFVTPKGRKTENKAEENAILALIVIALCLCGVPVLVLLAGIAIMQCMIFHQTRAATFSNV